MRSILLSAAVSIVIAVSVASPASAAAPAFDSAADPAYAQYVGTGAPIVGTNGGYGWGPWEEWVPNPSILLSPDVHAYANTTTGPSWFQSPVTSPGAAWVIPAELDGFFVPMFVERRFDGLLAVGQTLSFDCEGVMTIGILSPDGSGFTYEIDPGNPYRGSFQHSLPIIPFNTNVNYTFEGGHISITPIGSDHAILSITSYGPLGGAESLELPYADVNGVAFEANPGDLSGFVNNLSITPEPGSAALIAAAGLGLILRRSRRSRRLVR